MRHDKGVVYVVYGKKARTEAEMSIKTMRQYNDVPIVTIGDDLEGVNNIPFEQFDAGGRWAKVNADLLSPFESTLYIDADTRIRGDLSPGFDILSDGWDMAMTASGMQGEELLWHVGDEERRLTYYELGHQPVQLQAGVMFFRKNRNTKRLFAAWRNEWLRFKGEDQAAFLRALGKVAVRLWLLGVPYNGGQLVAHLFGRVRAHG